MDLLVPEVISLILKLGAMMVLIKAGFMSLCIGRKNRTLTARQQCYNDVHGWYRAHIEQPFARLWHWGLVRNIWRVGFNELHQSVRILLHFTQFCIRRQVHHPPYGPWEHFPPHVWTDQSNPTATLDEVEN